MSSNIRIQRICQHCGQEFTATRTTVSQYCGDNCSKRAYKARKKAAQVEASNKENWCYDVRLNSWTRKSDYPGNGYIGLTGFSIDGSGYVGLGERGVFATSATRVLYSTFFRYDPAADSWTRVSDFNGNVPIDKYTTSDGNLGLLIGTDGPYSNRSLPIYTFKP